MSRTAGLYELSGHLETLLGLLHLEELRHESASESFTRALHFYAFTNDTAGQVGSYVNLSEAKMLQREREESIKYINTAMMLLKQVPYFSEHLSQVADDTRRRVFAYEF